MRREAAGAIAAFALGTAAFALTGARATPRQAPAAKRVISLSPSITEMVFALGAGPRLVGVSAGVTWPPEAREIDSVGGYLDVDLERLVGLRPDLVLIQGLHGRVYDQARELGIRVRRVRMESVADIMTAARELGRALGVPAKAEELSRRIECDLDEIRARTRARARPRTFLHIAHGAALPRPPFLTTGGSTFLTEVLEIAGGENVFRDQPRPYAEVSAEALIDRAPEVVMVSAPGAKLSPGHEDAIREAWRGLVAPSARRGPRVVFLTAECAQVPGPRIASLAREMERLLWEEERARAEGTPP